MRDRGGGAGSGGGGGESDHTIYHTGPSSRVLAFPLCLYGAGVVGGRARKGRRGGYFEVSSLRSLLRCQSCEWRRLGMVGGLGAFVPSLAVHTSQYPTYSLE